MSAGTAPATFISASPVAAVPCTTKSSAFSRSIRMRCSVGRLCGNQRSQHGRHDPLVAVLQHRHRDAATPCAPGSVPSASACATRTVQSRIGIECRTASSGMCPRRSPPAPGSPPRGWPARCRTSGRWQKSSDSVAAHGASAVAASRRSVGSPLAIGHDLVEDRPRRRCPGSPPARGPPGSRSPDRAAVSSTISRKRRRRSAPSARRGRAPQRPR